MSVIGAEVFTYRHSGSPWNGVHPWDAVEQIVWAARPYVADPG